MNWTQTLKREMNGTYRATAMLLDFVKDDELDWKPPIPEGSEGTGFMTTGQLLHHLGEACGQVMEWFVDNSWPDFEANPPPESMGKAATVADARAAIEADRAKGDAAIQRAGEERMNGEQVTAPWGIQGTLGEQLLDCVGHLAAHKNQLFFYLKVLGRPVSTPHLWGMDVEAGAT